MKVNHGNLKCCLNNVVLGKLKEGINKLAQQVRVLAASLMT